MNTPTHVTLALTLLGEKNNTKKNWWIFGGAMVPDIAMFFLFFYEVIIGTPQRTIWNEKYFSPLWQNTIDVFNSIPIFVVLLVVATINKWRLIQVFCLAGLLHVLFDFPLHNDDAHRHFYPFSQWRFESPVSYWDPNFYGHYWSIIEMVLLLITGYLVWRMLPNLWARTALGIAVLFSIAAPLVFVFVL